MKRHHQDTILAVWHYKSVWGICGACRGPPNKIHMQDCITNVWKMYLGIYILVHWNEKFNIQLHASGLVPSGFFIFWNLSQLSKAQQDVAHHTFCFSHGIWKSNDTKFAAAAAANLRCTWIDMWKSLLQAFKIFEKWSTSVTKQHSVRALVQLLHELTLNFAGTWASQNFLIGVKCWAVMVFFGGGDSPT